MDDNKWCPGGYWEYGGHLNACPGRQEGNRSLSRGTFTSLSQVGDGGHNKCLSSYVYCPGRRRDIFAIYRSVH